MKNNAPPALGGEVGRPEATPVTDPLPLLFPMCDHGQMVGVRGGVFALVVAAGSSVVFFPHSAVATIGNGTLAIQVTDAIDATPTEVDIRAGEEVLFFAKYDDPDLFATPTTGSFDFGDGQSKEFGNVYEGCATPYIWLGNNAVSAVPTSARPSATGAVQLTSGARHTYAQPGTYTVVVNAFVERDGCALPGTTDESEWVTASTTVVVS